MIRMFYNTVYNYKINYPVVRHCCNTAKAVQVTKIGVAVAADLHHVPTFIKVVPILKL